MSEADILHGRAHFEEPDAVELAGRGAAARLRRLAGVGGLPVAVVRVTAAAHDNAAVPGMPAPARTGSQWTRIDVPLRRLRSAWGYPWAPRSSIVRRPGLTVSWDLLISTAGGVTATVVGVIAGGVVGRRGQHQQWLQGTQTAAYEKFLQAFGAVEAELREAFLDERRPAVDWVPFVAAQHSVSLVADPATSAAAERVCEILEDFTILFHGRQPTDLEELRPIHTALGEAHLSFVNAARCSLAPSQRSLDRSLGGPSPWRGVESFYTRPDRSLD